MLLDRVHKFTYDLYLHFFFFLFSCHTTGTKFNYSSTVSPFSNCVLVDVLYA